MKGLLMSDYINKYFRKLTKSTNNAIDILDSFEVKNQHLRQSFVNIIMASCEINIVDIEQFCINHLKYKEGMFIDVYDVIDSFNITNLAIQHAVKKLLLAGLRGHKDLETDLCEIISALSRANSFLV